MKPQSNNTNTPAKGAKIQSDERRARLAKALRDNLTRRKAVSRTQTSRSTAQGE